MRMTVQDDIFKNSFETTRVRIKAIRERLRELRRCESALTLESQNKADCLIPLGDTDWASMSFEEGKDFIARAKDRLQSLLEDCNKIEVKSQHSDTDPSLVFEIEEQLDDNDNIIEARVNGKVYEDHDLNKRSGSPFDNTYDNNQCKGDENFTSGSKSLHRDRSSTSDHPTRLLDVTALHDLENLAKSINPDEDYIVDDHAIIEDFEDSNESGDFNDDDEAFADSILYGSSLSLVPSNRPIERRLQEELQKLERKPKMGNKSRDELSQSTKNVRFDDKLDIATIEKESEGSKANSKKKLKFRLRTGTSTNRIDELKSVPMSFATPENQEVILEFIIERDSEHDGSVEKFKSDLENSDNYLATITTCECSTTSTAHNFEIDNETQRLAQQYYKSMYSTVPGLNGFMVDDLQDLKKLNSGVRDGRSAQVLRISEDLG